jgi:hypothetical protein
MSWDDELNKLDMSIIDTATDEADMQLAGAIMGRLGRGKNASSGRSLLIQRGGDDGTEDRGAGEDVGGGYNGMGLGDIEMTDMGGSLGLGGVGTSPGSRPRALPLSGDVESGGDGSSPRTQQRVQKMERFQWQQRQMQFGFFCSGIFIGFSILCIAVVTFGESLTPQPNTSSGADLNDSSNGRHSWGDAASADALPGPRRRLVAVATEWAWAWARALPSGR